MYDYEYEDDILLFLRLMKFLHTEHPFVLEQIIKDYPTADEEDIWMILDELLMAVFDEGAPDEGDDMLHNKAEAAKRIAWPPQIKYTIFLKIFSAASKVISQILCKHRFRCKTEQNIFKAGAAEAVSALSTK